MSLKSKLQAIKALKDTLASNINSKGVEASSSEGMDTLVPKVNSVGGHITDSDIEWTDDAPIMSAGYVLSSFKLWWPARTNYYTYNPFNYIIGWRDRYFNGSITGFGAQTYLSGSNSPLKWITYDVATSMASNAFTSQRNLETLILPSLTSMPSSGSISYCNALKYFEVGTITTFVLPTSSSQSANKNNMRMFKVGVGTDIDIAWITWYAQYVIAEGKTSCLELISNARTGLLERVADHSEDGLVRTITIGWVGTLNESEDEDVVTALEQLQTDFADKGWTLQG